MSLDRPNLTLDERSFEGLLSAAFVIQQHNDRRKHASQNQANVKTSASVACRHCGALKPSSDARCPSCGQDEFRPGERLQRNWASMWSESQEQENLHEQLQEQETAHDSVATVQANEVTESSEKVPIDEGSSENLDLEDTLLTLPQVYEEVSEHGYEPNDDQLHSSGRQDATRGRAPWNRRSQLEADTEQDSTLNISELSSDERPANEAGLVHTPAGI
jgi:hypothetical protein